MEALYKKDPPKNLVVENEEWVDKFLNTCSFFDIQCNIELIKEESLSGFIESCSSQWYIPKEYESFDIEEYLISKCSSYDEENRVYHELEEFKKRNMIELLLFLKYFIDNIGDDVILGVGRGSSVASYILYLLGIHRVNSIKYDIPMTDFFR